MAVNDGPSHQSYNTNIDNNYETTHGPYTNLGQHASSRGVIINNYQTVNPIEELEKYCSLSAAFDSAARFDVPRCVESTRLRIVRIIDEWINGDGDEAVPSSIFWLHGGAEVGKSALAQTLSEKYQENGKLAATFFFVRGDATRNDGAQLIPTLVSHLVDSFEGFSPFVEHRIRKNRNLFTKNYWVQIRELLIEPLLALKLRGALVTHPRLIVIDGLDECEKSSIQCELLRVISRAISLIPYPLRFLITSRPEAHITRIFNHDPGIQAMTIYQYDLSDERLEEKRPLPSLPPPSIYVPSPSNKARRRLSWSSSQIRNTISAPGAQNSNHLTPVALGHSDADTTHGHSDSEIYDEVGPRPSGSKPVRSKTGTGTKKSTGSSNLGYGRDVGKKDMEQVQGIDVENKKPLSAQKNKFLLYHSVVTSDSLIGSAFERKINDQDSIHSKADTTERLEELRQLMKEDNLDYYVVPSEDAHGSKYVASSDKRREFISGFTGSAGQAIIAKQAAYLFVDSGYWIQAENEIDENWTLIRTGAPGNPQDWIEWLVDRVNSSRIGIDARVISHEKAVFINSKIGGKSSKLVYAPQNLVDRIWKDRPTRSLEKIYIINIEFTGMHAASKLAKLREWISQQPGLVYVNNVGKIPFNLSVIATPDGIIGHCKV